MAYPTIEVEGRVVGVTPDFTAKGKQFWGIQFQTPSGEVQTEKAWSQDIANTADALKMQPAVITLSINGKWKNFESIRPGNAAAAPAVAAAPAAPAGYPPIPVAGAPDTKDLRISRGNAVNAASAALSGIIGTGYLLSEDGKLSADDVGHLIVGVARHIAAYIIDGPKAVASDAPVPAALEAAAPVAADELPPLPAGVTPEMLAGWAAKGSSVPVTVGAVPTTAAPTEEEKPY